MIPVDQTRFGGPCDPLEVRGNCFAAGMASIFELPLEAIPDILLDDDWWSGWQTWLAKRNLRLTFVNHPFEDGNPKCDWHRGYALISRESKMSKGEDGSPAQHVLVWKDDEILWDPNPRARSGSHTHWDDGRPMKFDGLFFFVVLDPSKPIGIP